MDSSLLIRPKGNDPLQFFLVHGYIFWWKFL